MEEDIGALKKRLETKIRETANDLREFTRERNEQSTLELRSEIRRLDYRISDLEKLIWNRLAMFLAGTILGIVISAVALLAFTSLQAGGPAFN